MSTHQHRELARIQIPFPVTLRGKDAFGDRFELHSTLDDLSGKDLSVRIARRLSLGSRVFAYVSLSLAPTYPGIGTKVAILGTVQHIEPVGGAYWRVKITINRHHFMYASVD
jgi:hypothetical protein